jgi:hypothetical protein
MAMKWCTNRHCDKSGIPGNSAFNLKGSHAGKMHGGDTGADNGTAGKIRILPSGGDCGMRTKTCDEHGYDEG